MRPELADGSRSPGSVVIEPRPSWKLIDWGECFQYRDLLYFLVLRDFTVLYKQTILGIAWAVLNPLFSMVVFTVIFGSLLQVQSDGRPYALFSFAALVPWTYFSQALTASAGSFISGASIFTKVYFPRIFIPLVPVLAKLVDFSIAMVMLGAMMAYYQVAPSLRVLLLPIPLLLMVTTAAGLGVWLSALAIQYRDVRHAMSFLVQILMYAAPVVWPVSRIPEVYRLWYGLYPMAGAIEGFRACILGSSPIPWDLMGMGWLTAIASLVIGLIYFRRTERYFADVS